MSDASCHFVLTFVFTQRLAGVFVHRNTSVCWSACCVWFHVQQNKINTAILSKSDAIKSIWQILANYVTVQLLCTLFYSTVYNLSLFVFLPCWRINVLIKVNKSIFIAAFILFCCT